MKNDISYLKEDVDRSLCSYPIGEKDNERLVYFVHRRLNTPIAPVVSRVRRGKRFTEKAMHH
jgi:hypothetical protein